MPYNSSESSNNNYRSSQTARRYRRSMIEDSDEPQSHVTRITQHLRNLKASHTSRSAKSRLKVPRKSRKTEHSGFVTTDPALQKISYDSIKESLSQKTSNYSAQIKKVLNILSENRKLLSRHKLCNRQQLKSKKSIFDEKPLGKMSTGSKKHKRRSSKANNIWCDAPEASYEIFGLPKLRDSKHSRHFQTYNIFHNKAYYPYRRKNIKRKRSYHQGEQLPSTSLGSHQDFRQVKSEAELHRDSVSSQEVKNIKTCILNRREKNRSQIRKLKKSFSGLSKTCAVETKVSLVGSNVPSQTDKKKFTKNNLVLDFSDPQISLQLDNVSKVQMISNDDIMLKQKGNARSHNSLSDVNDFVDKPTSINMTQLHFINQVHCTRILRYFLSLIIIIVWTPCLIIILLYGILIQYFIHKDKGLEIIDRKRSIKERLEFISCKYFPPSLRPLLLFLINSKNELKLKKYTEYNARSQSRKRIHSIFFYTDIQQSPKIKKAQSNPKFKRSASEQKSEYVKLEKEKTRCRSETLIHKKPSNEKTSHIVTSDKNCNIIAPSKIQNLQVSLEKIDILQPKISKQSKNAVKNALLSDIYAPPELQNSRSCNVNKRYPTHPMEKNFSTSHSRQLLSQKKNYNRSSNNFTDKYNNNKMSRHSSINRERNLNKSSKTNCGSSKQYINWINESKNENQQQTSERVLTTLPLAFKQSKPSCSCCSDICSHRPGSQGGQFKVTICPKSPPQKSKEEIELEKKKMMKKYKDCVTSCRSLLKGPKTQDQELMTEAIKTCTLFGIRKLKKPYQTILTKGKHNLINILGATKRIIKEEFFTPDDDEEEEEEEEEAEEEVEEKYVQDHVIRKDRKVKKTHERFKRGPKANRKSVAGEDLETDNVQYEIGEHDAIKQKMKIKTVSGEEIKNDKVQDEGVEYDNKDQKKIEPDFNELKLEQKPRTGTPTEDLKQKEVPKAGKTGYFKWAGKVEPPTKHPNRRMKYNREYVEKILKETRRRKPGKKRKRRKKRRKRKTIRQKCKRLHRKVKRKIFKQYIPKFDRYFAKSIGPPFGKCERLYFYTLQHKPRTAIFKRCPKCYPCFLRWNNLCRSFARSLIYCWCCVFWFPASLILWLCTNLFCLIF